MPAQYNTVTPIPYQSTTTTYQSNSCGTKLQYHADGNQTCLTDASAAKALIKDNSDGQVGDVISCTDRSYNNIQFNTATYIYTAETCTDAE